MDNHIQISMLAGKVEALIRTVAAEPIAAKLAEEVRTGRINHAGRIGPLVTLVSGAEQAATPLTMNNHHDAESLVNAVASIQKLL